MVLCLPLPAFGDPIAGGACNDGTLDLYIALAGTGCQAGGLTWSDFTFSASLNGAPIDPSELDISGFGNLSGTPGEVGFEALTQLEVPSGETLSINYGFAVTGTTYDVTVNEQGPDIASPGQSTVFGGCENGYFSGPSCSGLPLSAGPFPGGYFFSFAYPAAAEFAIEVGGTIAGQSGEELTTIIGEAETLPPPGGPVPEPSSSLMVGIALLPVGYRVVRRLIG
jgi:hypothetical protein